MARRIILWGIVLVACLGILSAIAYSTLRAFPNSGDEYAYVFQAQTLLNGGLWNAAPPSCELFKNFHIICRDGKWMGKYPIGWPALLSAVGALQLPYWAAGPLVGTATLLFFVFFTFRLTDSRTTAAIAGVSLFGTSFFLLNSASFFSHTLAALLGLLTAYMALKFLETEQAYFASFAGAFLGCLFLTRPYTALLIALPLAAFAALARIEMISKVKGATAGLVGVIPFLLIHAIYNELTTGSSAVTPFEWYSPEDRLGFVHGHTPRKALGIAWRSVDELAGWANPLLLLAALACFLRNSFTGRHDRRTLCFLAIFVTTLAGYMLYGPDPGNRYGPRYIFEGYVFLLLYVVVETFGRGTTHRNDVRLKALIGAVFLAGFVWGLARIPGKLSQEHRVVERRMDLFDQVEARGLDNAVVVIQSSAMGTLDLTRNGISLASEARGPVVGNPDVIYSNCGANRGCTDRNSDLPELHRLFPQRRLYRYRWDRTGGVGSLTEIRADRYREPEEQSG
jgi:hypothetical protein